LAVGAPYAPATAFQAARSQFVTAIWKFTATNKGWINRVVTLEWLEDVFIPWTKLQDHSQRRLLILDGHDSHTTTDFI
jgi:hypothetical protein